MDRASTGNFMRSYGAGVGAQLLRVSTRLTTERAYTLDITQPRRLQICRRNAKTSLCDEERSLLLGLAFRGAQFIAHHLDPAARAILDGAKRRLCAMPDNCHPSR
jgi:uncharacterized protein YjbI with pentapeptide repeats